MPRRPGPGDTQTQAEHLIARLEPRHVPAGRFHLARHIHAQPRVPRPPQPGHQPEAVRLALRYAVKWVDGSGADPDQDLIVPGDRSHHIAQVNHTRGTIPVKNSGFHPQPPLSGPQPTAVYARDAQRTKP